MKLVKLILFTVGVIIAIILVIITLIVLKIIVEDILYQAGLPNIGRPFHIDDIYDIMSE